jgi:hypothetical protein
MAKITQYLKKQKDKTKGNYKVKGGLNFVLDFRYKGSRAIASSLQSDLSNASQQLKLFQVDNTTYPTANNCPTPGATEICLKTSSGNAFTYTVDNTANPPTFYLSETNT